MNRRDFLQKAGFGLCAWSATDLRAMNLFSASNVLFKPYEIDLQQDHIQKLLKINSLPKTIRIDSVSQTPNRTTWVKGEGLAGQTQLFNAAVQRHNYKQDAYYAINQIITPTVLLQTPQHDIFGQFMMNEHRNFAYACIRGFDNSYYIVHPVFRRVFTYSYSCYGLPTKDYEMVTCRKCGEAQIRQSFQKSCDSSKGYLYAYPKCGRGDFHSFIPQIELLAPCGVADDRLSVGTDF